MPVTVAERRSKVVVVRIARACPVPNHGIARAVEAARLANEADLVV
jgi:hypothetical protein